MTATLRSGRRAAWTDRVGVVFALLAVHALALSALAQSAETPAQEPITAVYKAQEISFHYRSSTRFLPCYELEQQVAVILVAVGARDDIDVKARNCDAFMIDNDNAMDPMYGRGSMDPFEQDRWGASSRTRFGRTDNRREQYASVRIRLMMPVEVTPKILDELEKDKSRRDLVSRVTGNPAAAFNDPIVFAAQRQEVQLSQRTVRLRAEDCELVEQMAMTVLRKLDVKVLRRNSSCGPRDGSRIPPQLLVEALVPTGALLPMPAPEKEKETGAAVSDDPAAPPAEEPAEQQ